MAGPTGSGAVWCLEGDGEQPLVGVEAAEVAVGLLEERHPVGQGVARRGEAVPLRGEQGVTATAVVAL